MSEPQTTETVLFLKPTRLVVILLLVLFLLAILYAISGPAWTLVGLRQNRAKRRRE